MQIHLPIDQFQQYCELKLLSAEDDKKFIMKHITGMKSLNVCEIGCGNGKLLLSMEKENLISHAVGYEVSESRCKFANKFLNLYNSKKVEIRNKNFLKDASLKQKFDLIILVDIVFQFISPLYNEAEQDALQWLYNRLNRGGYLLFELEDYTSKIENIKKHGVDLFWEEFPKDDPFKYGLYKLDVDKDGNIVDDKIFIPRNSNGEEKFRSIIKPYTRNESIKLLERFGMKSEIYPYLEEKSQGNVSKEHDLYRVLAKKMD